jgi:tol-pal system protein YbgF
MAAASKETERLQMQVQGLQTQLATLQRAVEETAREVKRLNEALADQNATFKKGFQDQRMQDESRQATLKEIADRLAEISDRLRPGRVAPPSVSGGSPGLDTLAASPSPAPAAPGGTPNRELYSAAYADYARGNYDLAIQGFSEFIKSYPDSDLADNAEYWIGECLYGKQKYNEAVEAWNTLLKDYPSSDKLPDARVKKGMALEKLGRRSQALLEYRYVVDRYPNSSAARVAREKLNP